MISDIINFAMLVYLLAVSAFQCDKCDKVTIKCDGVNPQKFEFGMFMTNDWELALNSPIASRPSFRSRLYWFPQWFLRILRTTKYSETKATIPTTVKKVHLKKTATLSVLCPIVVVDVGVVVGNASFLVVVSDGYAVQFHGYCT